MPVGAMTSPTLNGLSLTKPVSSCPILGQLVQALRDRARPPDQVVLLHGLPRVPTGIDPINGPVTGPDSIGAAKGDHRRPADGCLADSRCHRPLASYSMKPFGFSERKVGRRRGHPSGRGSEHGELIGDLQPLRAKAIERGGSAAGAPGLAFLAYFFQDASAQEDALEVRRRDLVPE